MNASFAWGHRNKRGLGLDLRGEEGARLFRELVRQADVVAANFKPGTLESLGLSYAALSPINPGIIVCDSSAFGSLGQWSGRMGYGPLVRASCGISALWRDPERSDADPAAFCDGATVYPDHIAGHVAAVAVLAAVIGRARSGRGAALEIAQADVAVMHLGPALATESLTPGTVEAAGNAVPGHAPAGVFGCAGEDEWCVIDVRDDGDWARLTALLDRPELAGGDLATVQGRLGRRAEIEDIVRRWTAGRSPGQVTSALQTAGVPAGAMLRLPDELADPHLAARQSFRVMSHALLPRPVPANARIARFSGIADPPLRPAPAPGEHTRVICRTLLGLADAEIDGLARSGVLQPPLPAAAAGGGISPTLPMAVRIDTERMRVDSPGPRRREKSCGTRSSSKRSGRRSARGTVGCPGFIRWSCPRTC